MVTRGCYLKQFTVLNGSWKLSHHLLSEHLFFVYGTLSKLNPKNCFESTGVCRLCWVKAPAFVVIDTAWKSHMVRRRVERSRAVMWMIATFL